MKAEDQIRQNGGAHILVYAGDGRSGKAELLFSTGSSDESDRICELLLQLLEARRRVAHETKSGG